MIDLYLVCLRLKPYVRLPRGPVNGDKKSQCLMQRSRTIIVCLRFVVHLPGVVLQLVSKMAGMNIVAVYFF